MLVLATPYDEISRARYIDTLPDEIGVDEGADKNL